MRVAPIGLLHATDVELLRRDAAISAVITHADPMAVVSAVAQAFAVACLLHVEPGDLDVAEFGHVVQSALADLPDPGVAERRRDAGPETVRLSDRLADITDMLSMSPEDAFARLHNGAFVLESLPAAWWSFLRTPEDPERAIITAADGGYDADTVASMTAALAGAYHGLEAFPDRWIDPLEVLGELIDAADRLHELAGVHTGSRTESSATPSAVESTDHE